MPQLPDVSFDLGDGLTLTPISIDDVPAILEAVADEEILRWLPLPRPYTREVAESWCTTQAPQILASGDGIVRAMRLDGRMIGTISVKRLDWRDKVGEIGYWLAPQMRRRGVTTRAVIALSTWLLRDVGLERIELRIAPGNVASHGVAARAGFIHEGTLRNAGFTAAGRTDLVLYARVRSDLAADEVSPRVIAG